MMVGGKGYQDDYPHVRVYQYYVFQKPGCKTIPFFGELYNDALNNMTLINGYVPFN
jgi:hypothetical protein